MGSAGYHIAGSVPRQNRNWKPPTRWEGHRSGIVPGTSFSKRVGGACVSMRRAQRHEDGFTCVVVRSVEMSDDTFRLVFFGW